MQGRWDRGVGGGPEMQSDRGRGTGTEETERHGEASVVQYINEIGLHHGSDVPAWEQSSVVCLKLQSIWRSMFCVVNFICR